MAFFSANNFYYRITWAANGAGAANRRIHSDKNALAGSTTFEWKLLSPPRPENEIGGVMLQGVANDRPFLVSDANSWIYAGTGLHTYTGNGQNNVITSGANQNALPGIIGYEFDARASTTPGLSPYVCVRAGRARRPSATRSCPRVTGTRRNTWSDATLYTAPSGGAPCSPAGTIQWSWSVDNGYNNGYCGCSPGAYANLPAQRVTSNIINRFIGP